MSGCRWQEKSFSVAVKNKTFIFCRECGIEIDGRYKYNGDYFCIGCFSSKPNKGINGNFNTHKDLAYNFTTEMFNGKPIQIHSRRQFKHLLKIHGMADASIKECKQEAEFRKRLNNEDDKDRIRKSAEIIFEKRRNDLLRRKNA